MAEKESLKTVLLHYHVPAQFNCIKEIEIQVEFISQEAVCNHGDTASTLSGTSVDSSVVTPPTGTDSAALD